MLVAANVTKLANLVHRKVLADSGVPLVASFHMAFFYLACFFQMLLATSFTKLAEAKLEMFAYLDITRDQSDIRGGIILLNELNWFHFSFCGFLLKYRNWSKSLREMLPQSYH